MQSRTLATRNCSPASYGPERASEEIPGTVKPGSVLRVERGVVTNQSVGFFSEARMAMTRLIVLGIAAALLARSASGQDSKPPATPESLKAEKETRYLAFQIFTYGPDPKVATMGEGTEPNSPGSRTRRRFATTSRTSNGGSAPSATSRPGWPSCWGSSALIMADAEITKFIELGLNLALETDVAVGFHIDDSMFWARRKDLWSDPKNVEALDWDGTPCTGRRLDWRQGADRTRATADVFQQQGDPAGGAAALRPSGQGHPGGREAAAAAQKAGAVRGRHCRLGDHDRAGFQDGQVSRLSRAAQPGLQSRTPAAGHGPRAGKSRPGVHRTLDDRTRRRRCLPAENLLPHRVPLAPRLQARRQ